MHRDVSAKKLSSIDEIISLRTGLPCLACFTCLLASSFVIDFNFAYQGRRRRRAMPVLVTMRASVSSVFVGLFSPGFRFQFQLRANCHCVLLSMTLRLTTADYCCEVTVVFFPARSAYSMHAEIEVRDPCCVAIQYNSGDDYVSISIYTYVSRELCRLDV